jgi:hypothetical protein
MELEPIGRVHFAANDSMNDDDRREHVRLQIRVLADGDDTRTGYLAFDLTFELDLAIELQRTLDVSASAEERAIGRQWLTHPRSSFLSRPQSPH